LPFLFSSKQIKQEPGAHQITREWALRRRRPAAAPRVSPARAAPCGALGHAGSTKFERPQKTQAFFGPLKLRPSAGVVRKPPEGPLGWF